jgi:trigger factor
MKTTVTELPESRVRVEAAVPPDEVSKRMERAARALAGEMRLPGFRKGKVPAQLVIQRVGREAVLEQALRDSLPEWYERALTESEVAPVGDPKLDVGDLPSADEELTFSIEVAVRPKATLGEYRGLEVGKIEPEVPDEAVQEELDRLREGFASLNPVERAAAEGDLVSIDYEGSVGGEPFEGGEGHGQLVELGSGSLVEGFEEGLVGAIAGDERTVEVTFPEDYRAEELAGKAASFEVKVNEVREKELPELNDDFAADASEFDTLDELTEQIRERIGHALEHRAEDEFRTAAVDAAADAAKVEIPEEIARARAEESVERFLHSLEHRGVDPETFAKVQDGGREGMVRNVLPEAERNLRREATLAAIADEEGIEVTDDDLLEALGPGEGDESPRKILDRLRSSGRDQLLREEVRLRKAADIVIESAKPIPVEQAAAREAIWTPEKGRDAAAGGTPAQTPEGAPEPGKIWTPGS